MDGGASDATGGGGGSGGFGGFAGTGGRPDASANTDVSVDQEIDASTDQGPPSDRSIVADVSADQDIDVSTDGGASEDGEDVADREGDAQADTNDAPIADATVPTADGDAVTPISDGIWASRTPTTSPSPRAGSQFAEEGNGRAVLFSGTSPIRDLDPDATWETWEWNGNTGTWRNVSPTVQPPFRWGGSMEFDPVHNRVLLFGGTVPFANPNAGTILTDSLGMGRRDGNLVRDRPSRSQARASFGLRDGLRPRSQSSGRDRRRHQHGPYGHHLGVGRRDVDEHRPDQWPWPPRLPFGGVRRDTPAGHSLRRQRRFPRLGVGWISWLRRGDGLSGPAQESAAMAPTARGTVLLFGGWVSMIPRNGAASQGDTWEWNGTTGTWRKLTFTVSPGPREIPALVFDSARGRNVLFGGEFAEMAGIPGTFLGDTWEFTPPAD